MPKTRTFNMVPGIEVVPLTIVFEGENQVKITIEIV